ncbi:MAG: NAD(P)-dependent oxidoreductase [Chloroflexi bacterium]|nr:NAD(P)-dependent oxidoreductase [Chloroflexota bacterium]MCY3936934.1 NAD(P)-dependent oxidoreductase [Chloroflexota bacterium]
MERSLTIGFVGLGAIGSGVAKNLLKAGHDVVGFDLVSERSGKLAAAGGRAAASPRLAAEKTDYVMTALPEPKHLDDAVTGEDGIASAQEPPRMLIDLSTVDPDTTLRVAERLRLEDVRMLECKITGSSRDAENATMRLLAGGDEADLDEVRHVMDRLSEEIVYCGPLGTASTLKLIHNMLAFTIILADAEALTLGAKAGLDIGFMVDLFRKTVVWNRSLEAVFEGSVFERDFKPGFLTRHALKDVRLGTELASRIGSITPYAAVTQQMFTASTAKGFGEENFTSAVRLWEEVAGVELSA